MNISNNTIVTNHETAKTTSPATISLSGFADSDLITKQELCQCLGCSERTIRRMVDRFELPPPVDLGVRKVWIVGKIRGWFADAAERREAEALKEARRLRVFE